MKRLLETCFFFMYHLHMPPAVTLSLPIFEREWYVEKFVEQKKKENEAIEREKRKARAKSPRR